MSTIREQNNSLIQQLLQEHDRLGADKQTEKQALQRRILFLMTTIKMHELEEERNTSMKKAREKIHSGLFHLLLSDA